MAAHYHCYFTIYTHGLVEILNITCLHSFSLSMPIFHRYIGTPLCFLIYDHTSTGIVNKSRHLEYHWFSLFDANQIRPAGWVRVLFCCDTGLTQFLTIAGCVASISAAAVPPSRLLMISVIDSPAISSEICNIEDDFQVFRSCHSWPLGIHV